MKRRHTPAVEEELPDGDEMTSTETQFGLELPNGEILWDGYHNYPFTTEEQRKTMVDVLRKTAEQCGFAEEVFLSSYHWHRRYVTTTVRYYIGKLPVDSVTATMAIPVDD